MNSQILYSIILLSSIAVIFSVIIYFTDKVFKIDDSGYIDIINEELPGLNCGACGYAGCRELAKKLVETKNTDVNSCPVGGDETKEKIISVIEQTDD